MPWSFRGLGVALCLCGASLSTAGTFDFTGAFFQDDNLASFDITLSSPGTIGLLTTSYAQGGFPTVLSVFGPLPSPSIQAYDAGPTGGSSPSARAARGTTTNPATGLCLDASLLNLNLPAAGTYMVILTEQDNIPTGDLTSPFSEAGNGNFTDFLYGGSGPFVDPSNPGLNDSGNRRRLFRSGGCGRLRPGDPQRFLQCEQPMAEQHMARAAPIPCPRLDRWRPLGAAAPFAGGSASNRGAWRARGRDYPGGEQ